MLGLWDGNPVKLDFYDHYTPTDVINSFEQLKKWKKNKFQRSPLKIFFTARFAPSSSELV